MQHSSAMTTRSLVKKKKDPGDFTIPCTIWFLHIAKSFCDLGASINFISLSIFRKLGLGDPSLLRCVSDSLSNFEEAHSYKP